MIWTYIGIVAAYAIGFELSSIMRIRKDIIQVEALPHQKEAVVEYLRKNLQRSIRAAVILTIGFLLFLYFAILMKNDVLPTAQAVLDL